jgi:hypothetical protein
MRMTFHVSDRKRTAYSKSQILRAQVPAKTTPGRSWLPHVFAREAEAVIAH